MNRNATKKITKTNNTVDKLAELIIGTWNINTINGKEEEIVEEIKDWKIQIMGISETKKKGKGFKILKDGYTPWYTLYYSGHDERCKEGVGIIIAEETNKKITNWNPVTSRIIDVELEIKKGMKLIIIQVYAPIQGSIERDVEEFYTELQNTVDKHRERTEHIIITGDWNSRIGNDQEIGLGSMGEYGEKERNSNGIKMINFCIANDLLIGNSFHKQEIYYTFEAPERNAKSLIDYIVYTKEASKTIQKVWVNKYAELSTPHKLVLANMSITESEAKSEPGKAYTKIKIEKRTNEERIPNESRRKTSKMGQRKNKSFIK